MSVDALRRDAEYAKLARVLHCAPEDLAFLDTVDLPSLAELRWGVSDRMQAADASRLQGVAAASKLVPIPVAASIGRKFFGAELCARLVGLIEPARGAQFAGVLPLDFMADITQRTDPRVVGPLAARLRTETMQQIAIELVDRGDHITLSHFVPHLPPATVADILGALPDDTSVVRVAQFVDDGDALTAVVAELGDERVQRIIDAVADHDLWVEGFALYEAIGSAQATRIAAVIVALGDERLLELLDSVDRSDLWPSLLGLLDRMDPSLLGSVAPLLADLDDAVIDRALDAAALQDVYEPVARCAIAVADEADLDAAVRARLGEVIDRQDPERIASFVAAATAQGRPDVLDELRAG